MPRKSKQQLAAEAAEEAALQTRREVLAEDKKTLQELTEMLSRKIAPGLRLQALKLRDEVVIRIQQRVDIEAREAQQRIIDREQTSTECEAKVPAISERLRTAQARVTELEGENSKLKTELATTCATLNSERTTAEALRTRAAKAEARLAEVADAVFTALRPFTDEGRALERVAKRYFEEGHRVFDPVYAAFGFTAETVENWRREEDAKKSDADWQAIREQNATLSSWSGRSPAPKKPTPAKRTPSGGTLIPEPKPAAPVDPLDVAISELPPLPDSMPDVEVLGDQEYSETLRELNEKL